MSTVLDEALRLHALGFAIHWIAPKSKRPIEKKWTSGERKTVDQLKASYKPGFNVGVRLGTPSKINGKYLAVIDCDMKSEELSHLSQMEEAIEKLLPQTGPSVASGRANGSRHFFVTTDKPAEPKRITASNDKVKVHMPSVEASATDRKHLDDSEIEMGYRWRPAFEICFMGEGQQVVLPPSIHPDSGKRYRWQKPFEIENLPLLGVIAQSAKTSPRDKVGDLKALTFEEVELIGSGLSGEVIDAIVSGEGVEDRSAYLMTACRAMVLANFTPNQILSVLTDPVNELSSAARDRRGESRESQAAWVKQYSLDRVREGMGLSDDPFKDAPPLDDVKPRVPVEMNDADARLEEVKNQLERVQGNGADAGKPKNSLTNAYAVLNALGAPALIRYDRFAIRDRLTCNTPWGGIAGTEYSERYCGNIRLWLAQKFRFDPGRDKVDTAILNIADQNAFHPVQDYLNGLTWDGVPRIDTWLRDFLGANETPEPLLSAISRKTIMAMIQRIFEPGCKFDHVTILEGIQNSGKSSAVNILGGEWAASPKLDLHSKDSVLALQGKWLIEFAELTAINHADQELVKHFISNGTDRIRTPYGRTTLDYPRQCVFIGTTNLGTYMKDISGNRRYWPVPVGQTRFDELAEVRDQLFAEAMARYRVKREHLDFRDEPEAQKQAGREQDKRRFEDGWVEIIDSFLDSSDVFDSEKISLTALFESCDALGVNKVGMKEQYRAADALRLLGYREKTVDIQKSPRKKARRWVKK